MALRGSADMRQRPYDMASIYSRVISFELPARFLWQDEHVVAILDIHPCREGHALVIPRREIDHWEDVDEVLTGRLMRVAQLIGRAQKRAFQPKRISLLVAGFGVPHIHLHVMPVDSEFDVEVRNHNLNPDPRDLDRAARAIRRALCEITPPPTAPG
ncbi:MAG: HIT family protein [Polyangiales bacterium]